MISFTNLSKCYGAIHVLRDINLQVSSGRITAIIGPNGSGKTTLIKTLLGHVKPAQGIIRVDSDTLNGHWEYRRRIGYMPQLAQFPDHLSISEIIGMVKDIRGGEQKIDDELFYQFKLDKELNKPKRTLSGGTRQKLNAVIAFLFSPDILAISDKRISSISLFKNTSRTSSTLFIDFIFSFRTSRPQSREAHSNIISFNILYVQIHIRCY